MKLHRRRTPREVRRDVEEEIGFHLDLRRRELEAAGLSPAAAREEARRRFGDLDGTRRRCVEHDLRRERRMSHRELLSDLAQDLTIGARSLRARPGFACATVLTLAVGIAAATTVFSVADHVALRPLPYRGADRVVTAWQTDRAAGGARGEVAAGNFLSWRERATTFAAIGLAEPYGFDLAGEGRPVPVSAWLVTPDFLPALGVSPLRGRLLTPEDGDENGPRGVLIAEDLWRRRFAADQGLVGRGIELDGRPVTVLGILPATAEYPEPADVWALKVFRPDEREDRRADYRDVVARLRPGVALAEAQAEMDEIAGLLAAEHPVTNAHTGALLVPLREQVLGPVEPALHLLLAAVFVLLAIACFNVSGLLLARGAERQREIAVRGALGASRGRLGRQLVAESLLLAAAGGALGVVLAGCTLPLLVHLLPAGLPRGSTVALDGRVLLFAVAVTTVAGIAASLAPALRLSRPDFATLLGAGARASDDGARSRLRSGLVVGEIALALVLLVASGLLLRSFGRLLTNELGFDPSGRVSLQLFLWDRNPTAAARAARVAELGERFAALPGVASVGVVSALPFHPHAIDIEAAVRVEGRPAVGAEPPASAFVTVASPGYFPALDIPLVAGRLLDARDRAGGPPVALVNRALARRLFPAADPLRHRLVLGDEGGIGTCEIVGVVGDVRSTGLDAEPQPEVFLAYDQSRTGSVTFVLAGSGDPAATLAGAQQIVWQLDPEQTIYHVATLEDLVATTLAERRFHLLLFATFSALALLLAGLGTFGLVSFSTRQRTHEFGIRLALGAAPGDVVAAALRQGIGLGLPGVILGTFAGLLASRALAPLLYGVTPTDPATFLPVAGLMLLVALVGAWLPGRRVSRLHPASALRTG